MLYIHKERSALATWSRRFFGLTTTKLDLNRQLNHRPQETLFSL